MKATTSLAMALVVTASSLSAQNVYIPQSTEGSSYSYYFGRYANARAQMLFGKAEFGTGAKVFKSMALRLDARSHSSTFTAQGRTWTNCTLKMSQSNYSAKSTTFANNIVGTPTTCFSGSVTWTSQAGLPSNSPAKWGGHGQDFVFTTVFVHTDTDVCVDVGFTGGKLKNGTSLWSGSRSYSFYNDGHFVPSPYGTKSGSGLNIPRTRLNNTTTRTTCNDSAHTRTTGAYLYSWMNAFGPKYYTPHSYAGKLRYYAYSYYTAPDAAVLHLIGISKTTNGLDLGTGCNKLHMGIVVAVQALKTPPLSVNSSSYSGYDFVFANHTAGLVGIELVTQGLWNDSKTGKLLLTQADTVTVPTLFSSTPSERHGYYSYLGASSTRANFSSTSQLYNPMVCFTQ